MLRAKPAITPLLLAFTFYSRPGTLPIPANPGTGPAWSGGLYVFTLVPSPTCLLSVEKKTHGIPEPGHPQRVCVQKTVYRGQGPSGREFLEKEMVVVRQNDGATSGDLWNAPLPPPPIVLMVGCGCPEPSCCRN